MELARVNLEDKYTLQSGRIYLTGIQALVRLPLMQRARPRRRAQDRRLYLSRALRRDRFSAGKDPRLRSHQGAQRRSREGVRGRIAGAIAQKGCASIGGLVLIAAI